MQPAIKEVTMNKVLLALSMLTALSAPALASYSKAQGDSANAAFTDSKGGVEAFFNER
jgi:nucleoside-specific outer membrane channel protein Tsx